MYQLVKLGILVDLGEQNRSWKKMQSGFLVEN